MIVEGPLLAIDRANIDTDQIIPAKFLTGVGTTGLGEHLFSALDHGAEILANKPDATVLVTRENFGCGSSREHAVWALRERGFRAVVAPSFARIFQENAYASGVVPVIVGPQHIDAVFAASSARVDVEAETLVLDGNSTIRFSLDPLRKRFLLEGGLMEFLNAKIPLVRTWLEARPV